MHALCVCMCMCVCVCLSWCRYAGLKDKRGVTTQLLTARKVGSQRHRACGIRARRNARDMTADGASCACHRCIRRTWWQL